MKNPAYDYHDNKHPVPKKENTGMNKFVLFFTAALIAFAYAKRTVKKAIQNESLKN